MREPTNTRLRAASSGTRNSRAIEAAAELSGQLAFLMEAAIRETWLPMGFRTRLAEEIPALNGLVSGESADCSVLAERVAQLREAGNRYSGIARQSEVLVALDALEKGLKALEAADS